MWGKDYSLRGGTQQYFKKSHSLLCVCVCVGYMREGIPQVLGHKYTPVQVGVSLSVLRSLCLLCHYVDTTRLYGNNTLQVSGL